MSSGYHVLYFIARDLQLYKIYKITRVSFFGTQCMCSVLYIVLRLPASANYRRCFNNLNLYLPTVILNTS